MACQYSLTPLAHLDTPAEELQQELQKKLPKTQKRKHASGTYTSTTCYPSRNQLLSSDAKQLLALLRSPVSNRALAIPPFIQKLRTSPQLQLLS